MDRTVTAQSEAITLAYGGNRVGIDETVFAKVDGIAYLLHMLFCTVLFERHAKVSNYCELI